MSQRERLRREVYAALHVLHVSHAAQIENYALPSVTSFSGTCSAGGKRSSSRPVVQCCAILVVSTYSRKHLGGNRLLRLQ